MERILRYRRGLLRTSAIFGATVLFLVFLYGTVYPLLGLTLSAKGREAYRAGQYERGERLLSWSCRMGWLDRDVWGAAAYRLGKYEEVARVMESLRYRASSTSIDPPAREVSLLGLAQVRSGAEAEGLKSLRNASEREPSVWMWHHNLAVGLDLSGRREEAAKERSIARRLGAPVDLVEDEAVLFPYESVSQAPARTG